MKAVGIIGTQAINACVAMNVSCCGLGCTVGSTMVDQHLKELRDAAPVNASTTDRGGCRPPRQQSSWSVPRSRADMDQSVFRIYKGIKCFDFCKSQNVIATGGTSLPLQQSCRHADIHRLPWVDFDVDSSSRFAFRARTNRQTDRQRTC